VTGGGRFIGLWHTGKSTKQKKTTKKGLISSKGDGGVQEAGDVTVGNKLEAFLGDKKWGLPTERGGNGIDQGGRR